jgi:hypothetical protein
METTLAAIVCDGCGAECKPQGCTSGYGISPDGKRYCFDCCAVRDRETMERDGNSKSLPLYLVERNGRPDHVGNWPGTLTYAVRTFRRGRHNIAGTRIDVWFAGPGGEWHGTQYGEWTQIVHCKRVKA